MLISLVQSRNYLGLILKPSRCMGEKKISECISEDSANVLILKTKIQSIHSWIFVTALCFYNVKLFGSNAVCLVKLLN